MSGLSFRPDPMGRLRRVGAAIAASALLAGPALATEIDVMTSGAFTAAYRELVPAFEHDTGHTIRSAFGASQGGAADSIPSRLDRGEPADVVILARPALDALVKAGKVVPGSEVDLVRSSIGMVVRAGAPRPDIATVEALKQTLLAAKSVAYSASASGTYLSTELFPKLGVAEAIAPKLQRIESARVAAVVARGDAEIGFQQVSELLPVPGVDFVGVLPEGAQRATFFSAGITTTARAPEAARALIRYFGSPAAAPVIERTGLEALPAR
ncbi:molybdate ABC transporter substrate-binding protein [Derxia lacustris]|uniref:molybdate ABC transporter substrate-binding protein n=1 Tax=Derxia lacustris TaxID=764842 RepID=UPI000A178703|nr:molybdate ABC transporter substrate-binding protein [Derxia lacustris]